MLLNDLYTIHDWQPSALAARATLILNPEHPIFRGHFPDQPVLPGACMLLMIREMMEEATGLRLRLLQARTIKFLLPVTPGGSDGLLAEWSWQDQEDAAVDVKATLLHGSAICFRFAGSFGIDR